MLELMAVLLVIFIGSLYFIMHNKSKSVPLLPTPNNHLGNSLPPKPEERWRYIKELENHQISIQTPTKPIADSEVKAKNSLTADQRKLLEQMQADMQKRPTQLNEVRYNASAQVIAHSNSDQKEGVIPQRNLFKKAAISALTRSSLEAKSAVKQDRRMQEAKSGSKKKWIVQCGLVRTTDQAEPIRARLAFEGIESHITTGDGWNRIIIGPYSSHEMLDKTLSRLHAIGMSNCLTHIIGG